MSMREMSWVMNFKDNASKSIERLQKNFSNLEDGIENTGKTSGSMFKKMGESTEKLGKKMDTLAGKTKKLSMAAGGLLGLSFKNFAEFEESMSFVQAQGDLTNQEIQGLTKSVKELKKHTSSIDLSKMLGTYASAGLNADEMEGLLGISDKVMTITKDQEVTTDMFISGKNIFGIDITDAEKAEQAADKYVKAQAMSNVNVDELIRGNKKAAPAIQGTNMALEESLALMIMGADQGLVGEQVGTSIAAMQRDLIGSAKDGKVSFGEFTMSLYDLNGEAKSLPEIMKEIEKGTEGMSNAQRDAAINSVLGANSQKIWNAYIEQGGDVYDEYKDSILDSSGEVESKSETMTNNLMGDLKELKAQLGDVFLDMGELLMPVFKTAVDGLQNVVGKIKDLSPKGKKILAFGTLVVASLSPVFAVLGKVFLVVSKMFRFFGIIKKGISVISAFMAANPIVLGIIAIVAAGVLLYKNWDVIKEKVTALKEKMSEVFGAIGEKWQELKTKLSEAITGKIDAIKEGFQNGVAGVQEKWSQIKGFLGEVARGYVEAKKERFEMAIQTVRNIWSGIKSFMAAPLSGKVQAVTDGFGKAIDAVKNKWKEVKALLKSPISGTINLFQNLRNKGKAAKDGSHKTGLDNVPFDGYIAELHKDEMVLTRGAANQFRAMGGNKDGIGTRAMVASSRITNTTNSNTSTNSINVPDINITVHTNGDNPQRDGQLVGQAFAEEMEKYLRQVQATM